MRRLGLHLRPQPLDGDVDEARIAQVVVAPDLVEEQLPREDLAGPAGQLGEQAELGVAEGDLMLVATDGVRRLVDLERSEAERAAGLGRARAAQRDAQPGDQLGQLERLAHVVIGAGLESCHDVEGVGPGGQHDDRDGRLEADGAAHGKAVQHRQHDVEDHRIGLLAREPVEGLAAVGRIDHLVAGRAQPDRRQLADRGVVLDQKNPVRHQRRCCHTPVARNGWNGPACYRATVDATLMAPVEAGTSGVVSGGLEVHWLGRIAYERAWKLQKRLAAARADERIDDQLLLLEHPPVLTLGRTSDPAHVLASPEALAARGIDVVRVERGGEVTYHGPGQLVAYPIIGLGRRGLLVRPLVRALEGAMIDTCRALGVEAGRRDGHPGCWVDPDGPAPRKIGALGLRIERGVSYHGIALNVTVELADFDLIDACGMPGVVSTSVAAELGRPEPPSTASVATAARHFAEALAGRLGIEGGGLADPLPEPAAALDALERTLAAAGA